MKQHSSYTSRRNFLRFAAHSSAALLAASVAPNLIGRAQTAHAAEAVSAIVGPRFVNPAFAEAGGTFSAEVRGERGFDASGWTVSLENDLHVSWPCSVEAANYTSINNGREQGWQLIIRVPAGISSELMHLNVNHRAGTWSQAQQAVSIVPRLDDPFYLFHMTDEHVMRELQSQIPSGDNKKSGYRTAQLATWATQVVNVINPRIVVHSGDQVNRFATTGYEYDFINDFYSCYRTVKRGYRAPSMVVIGNHDINQRTDRSGQYADWERILGQRYYVVRMGSLAIFGHDYTDNEAKRWTLDTYASMYNQSDIAGRVVVQHFTDWEAVRIPKQTPASLMLIGHLHDSKIVQNDPFPILMTEAAHNYARAGHMRFERDNQGRWFTPDVATWKDSYIGLVGDNGKPSVWTNYDTPNDGRATTNRVVVSNSLDRSFPDGRVRLLMADGNYSVQGGDMLSSYAFLDKDGQRRRAIVVRVSIAAKAATTITVQPGTAAIASFDDVSMQPVAVNNRGIPLDILPEYEQPAIPAAMDGGSAPANRNLTQRVWVPAVSSK